MKEITITLPDGGHKNFEAGIKPVEVAQSISRGLADSAVVARVNGKLIDLSRPIEEDSTLAILTPKNPEALVVYRHSSAHLLALAVTTLFPEVQLGIGPPIENGFFYDFYREEPFTAEDLERIEKKMLEFVQQDLPYERIMMEKKEGMEWFRQHGATLKCELIAEKAEDRFSCYTVGTLVDFCLGPHVSSTGKIKAIKLLSVAGAYWKGDERNLQLQRIYGTSFFSKQELENFLKQLEEAKKRDHRKIGKELDLFSLQEQAGPGLVFWHPKGALIRSEIENFWKAEHLRAGYDFVYTPHIAKLDLWRTSGHVDFYKDSMYSAMKIDETDYQLKPMNCPFHILIYKNDLRSYRDLPLRWAETGTVYRYERSGVLAGLFRVRGFTQDDAHIFCQPEKIETEIQGVIDFTLHILKSFGFEEFEIFVSTRPEKYVGSPEDWRRAEEALKRAVELKKLSYSVEEGGGAFYGPKIDVKIKDAIGRSWQCSTIQFDFNLPERFDISYIGEDGKAHRPYMVHRALLGSMERFFGVLIEHYAGAFPLWLAPVQVILLPISERHIGRVQELEANLNAAQFRTKSDLKNEKIGLKIRRAQLEKIPFMVVIGDKETENGTLSVRNRFEGDMGSMSYEQFLSLIQGLKTTRAVKP